MVYAMIYSIFLFCLYHGIYRRWYIPPLGWYIPPFGGIYYEATFQMARGRLSPSQPSSEAASAARLADSELRLRVTYHTSSGPSAGPGRGRGGPRLSVLWSEKRLGLRAEPGGRLLDDPALSPPGSESLLGRTAESARRAGGERGPGRRRRDLP
jgi:hypothetical protein